MPPPSGSTSTSIVGTPSPAATTDSAAARVLAAGTASSADHSHGDAARAPGRPRHRPADRPARTGAAAGRRRRRHRARPRDPTPRSCSDRGRPARGDHDEQPGHRPAGRRRQHRPGRAERRPRLPGGDLVVRDLRLDAGRRAQPEQLVEQDRLCRDEQRPRRRTLVQRGLDLATAHGCSHGSGRAGRVGYVHGGGRRGPRWAGQSKPVDRAGAGPICGQRREGPRRRTPEVPVFDECRRATVGRKGPGHGTTPAGGVAGAVM